MKLSTLAAAAALAIAGLSAPAIAQSAAVSVGAKIFGPDGAEVGTVEQVQGENVVVNTGSVTAAPARSSSSTRTTSSTSSR